ncbi:uncharacterized protein HMPREF1541_08000 [Cyphellophora europaea CBS 101466]|uniref:NAD(P)-binding protein n=1 Tax=Cyphellophora europaea (strain CBS 101466) TaxID=1220924 RepID=W2RKK1_CYPE1|nr:uncharacterized protein HMPREF1541_08000 [Cyphellophora europaea CBS 101466]ETN37012.1 hypothetical protein HMPREF1541_08000 [Cyphellophora europaea CBS 101466]
MPTYIITGANRGLGLEFARQLTTTAPGPNTVLACVRSLQKTDLSALNQLSRHSSNNSTLTIHECDTSSIPSIHAFAASLPDDTKVDLLNNAGINSVPEQDSLNLTGDELQRHIATNVLGPAEMVKALLPWLSAGSVVFNMSSGMGSLGRRIVGDGKAVYAISKAALNMLSVHQAKDLEAKGVKVIVMDPGWVKTDMGGPRAVLEQEYSIGSMLKVVEQVKADDAYVGKAKFFQYDGKEVLW